jgi:hypothetical protein
MNLPFGVGKFPVLIPLNHDSVADGSLKTTGHDWGISRRLHQPPKGLSGEPVTDGSFANSLK